MKNGNKYFKTGFGDKIPVLPGHYEYHDDTYGRHSGSPKNLYKHFVKSSTNVAGGFEKLDASETLSQRVTSKSVSYKKYSITYMNVQLFLHLLRTYTDAPAKFQRMLDIGCGMGMQPRILKGLGVADEAVGLDLFDRATSISDSSMRLQHRKLRFARFLEPIMDMIEKKPAESRSEFEQALLTKISTPRRTLGSIVSVNLPMDVYKQSLGRNLNFDDFIEGNVFDHTGNYDLITSFSSIEWFALDEIMSKISKLLETSGIFFMYVGSWWYPNNVSSIYGHFPYAAQRLNADDFLRYAHQFHKEDAEYFKTAYEYFDPAHPTISDYIEAGLRHDLVPLHAVNLAIPGQFDRKRGITPAGYAEYCPGELEKVLDNVRKFRPDVRMEDLFSGLYYIIFRKRSRQSTLTKQKLNAEKDRINFQYRPKSKLGKSFRELGIWLTQKSADQKTRDGKSKK